MNAPSMIAIGEGGSINPAEVVLVASMTSAPVKRLVRQTDPQKIVNLTYGYPRRSLIVFANGFIAITHLPVDALTAAVCSERAAHLDNP
jgi:regulator of extracellular matrix RemA (YlzA/DUF370 family)